MAGNFSRPFGTGTFGRDPVSTAEIAENAETLFAASAVKNLSARSSLQNVR